MSDWIADFPGRPTHPDFGHLSEVVLRLDAKAAEGDDIPTMISEYADFESVFYMARMRAMKALDLIGLPQKLDGLLISVFLNAFSAGVEYERKYGTPD